jgi:hypothetical protein
VGAENGVISCVLLVFADVSTESIPAPKFKARVTHEFVSDLKHWVVTREPPAVAVRATGYEPADVEIG